MSTSRSSICAGKRWLPMMVLGRTWRPRGAKAGLVTDILELIDGAIADATSLDAMRWTPEGDRETSDPVGQYRAVFESPTVEDVARWFGLPSHLLRG